MLDLNAAISAGAIGIISGFLVCIPVGPINITIINEGAKRGFRWALMISIGAMVMDFIYCGFAFAGFSTLLSSRTFRATMELLSFILTLFLGIKYMLARDLP